MKKVNKIGCLIMVIAILFGDMGSFAYAVDGGVNYYYIVSINGDNKNSGTDINNPKKLLQG